MDHIKLGFMEDTTQWCQAWSVALGVGATVEAAEISSALAQWAVRDMPSANN